MIVVYDELYTEHLRGTNHPESPDRVAYVAGRLGAAGLLEDRVAARDASDAELERVHPHAYLERVKRDVETVGARAGYLSTGDTAIDASSLSVARRAAGGALAAMEAAIESERSAFALVRPPGHHAEPARGMGFCVFGNAAVAARAFATAPAHSSSISITTTGTARKPPRGTAFRSSRPTLFRRIREPADRASSASTPRARS